MIKNLNPLLESNNVDLIKKLDLYISSLKGKLWFFEDDLLDRAYNSKYKYDNDPKVDHLIKEAYYDASREKYDYRPYQNFEQWINDVKSDVRYDIKKKFGSNCDLSSQPVVKEYIKILSYSIKEDKKDLERRQRNLLKLIQSIKKTKKYQYRD